MWPPGLRGERSRPAPRLSRVDREESATAACLIGTGDEESVRDVLLTPTVYEIVRLSRPSELESEPWRHQSQRIGHTPTGHIEGQS
jgi:hypothetical protein